MNHGFKRSLQWLSILLTQIALISCATGQHMYYFHSFSFDTGADAKVYGQPEVEVLNYEYGSSRQFATRPSEAAWELNAARGIDVFWANSIAGEMPRGEYLYVKWRIKATGEVFEDKVDLTKRMPSDIKNYGLHFAVFGSKLYVYLFPPFKTTDALGRVTVHGGQPPVGKRGQTLLDIPSAQKHQIYPDKNK